MSYVLSGYGIGDLPVEEMSNEELVELCSQENSSVTGAIANQIALTISKSPCVELAIRSKINANAKRYGPFAVGGVLVLGIIGGLLAYKSLR